MSGSYYNRFSIPITTGTPRIDQHPTKRNNTAQKGGTEFAKVLENQLKSKIKEKSKLAFSKHAINRAVERQVELSESSISRLNEGVRIAGSKGLNDTLIVVDNTAFIVNVKNNTVITTVNDEELKGSVFTNIDGTVII